MPLNKAPSVEPLGTHHDRAGFSCGEAALDSYLRTQAGQDVRSRVCRIFVATLDDRAVVAGFYALSATAVEARNLPADLSRKLPKYPLSAALIGRLAVDERFQGLSLGKYLLMDAIARTAEAASSIGIYAVIVDAKNEPAKAFYEKYGFKAFPTLPRRLFIPLKTAAALLAVP